MKLVLDKHPQKTNRVQCLLYTQALGLNLSRVLQDLRHSNTLVKKYHLKSPLHTNRYEIRKALLKGQQPTRMKVHRRGQTQTRDLGLTPLLEKTLVLLVLLQRQTIRLDLRVKPNKLRLWGPTPQDLLDLLPLRHQQSISQIQNLQVLRDLNRLGSAALSNQKLFLKHRLRVILRVQNQTCARVCFRQASKLNVRQQ